MTLRFTDGFDHYSFAQIGWKWTTTAQTHTISTTGARNGSSLTFSTSTSGYIRKTLDNQATYIVGFAAKFPTIPTGTTGCLLSFIETATSQISIVFSNNYLVVKRNGASGTILGTTSSGIPINTWCYIEIKVTVNNTTGVVVIKINGNTVLNLTSQNTRQTANNYSNIIGFNTAVTSSGTGIAWLIDDVYICDGTSAGTPPNNDFLGDIKIETLYPNADGANLTWTPSTGVTHNTLVDETPANDDTDYISTNTANNKETFGFTDLVTTTGTVYGGQLLIAARADDGITTHTIAPIIRHSATDNIGTTSAALTASYTYYTQCYDKNPGSAAQFTISDVNADEYGCRMIA